MTDSYPEYLNPFAEDVKPKSRLSISHSFKGFKKTLRKSFRIKKKEDEEITIRQKVGTIRRIPMSYPNNQIALPRSRFRERLSKCEPTTTNAGPNPFEEEQENKEEEVKAGTTKRRGKKRAPLPPKSLSSQNINTDNLDVPSRGSHWSLTSADTDYSGSTDNISERVETEADKEAMLEKFMDFNKEMDKLKDDSNNNTITKEEIHEETESHNNVPDLVIACPSDTESAKLSTNEDEVVADTTENRSECNTNEDKSHEDNCCTSDSDSNAELVVTDITNNMIDENNKINTVNDENIQNSVETFLYNERKSLYITGSKDELNEPDTYTDKVSLYITGSRDDLDACNNNEVCDKKEIDENSNDDTVPIPKQRKNKLSKNILLGV